MGINILRNSPSPELLRTYSEASIAFTVKSRFRVDSAEGGLGSWILSEERVEPPYEKDYDGEAGGRVDRWLSRWDISDWAVFAAMEGNDRLGAAIAGYRTPGALLEEGREDLAVLWDIRVRSDRRGAGIGSQLFSCAVEWARDKDCKQLKVETQDINVPACRFYADQGCELRSAHRNAYPEVPHEVWLLWYRGPAGTDRPESIPIP